MPKIPSPQDMVRGAAAQTEALLQLPGLIITLTNQVRALTESIATLNRMAVKAEGLLEEIEPGIKRVAKALDDPIVDEIPETLRQLQGNLLPIVKSFRDTQSKVAAIADSTTRLAGLPGAALFGTRRPRPHAEDEQDH